MTTVIDPTAPDTLVRVVKGSLADEELAALTAVLLARAAVHPVKGGKGKAGGGAAGDAQAQARWQRPERRPDYRSPVSWHS
ncbi:acyl-CoA carboxylase epsilon subunit [Streptacidiphilus sp. N1-3]|uniref:Acyl-CoA carboxylase epsilon subunit n=1 Tax=Streptacidiphilus alkalitolerans TaxID=3342712 RepID=A0ABV6WT36_9ACTN